MANSSSTPKTTKIKSPVEINEVNRDQFGGDIAITSTIPLVHPKLGIPLDQTRKSLTGASYLLKTFWRGDIVYIPDPTLEFNFTWYTDDGHQQSRKYWMLLTMEKGFEECKADEWSIRKTLQKVYSVIDNRICLPVGRNAVGKDEYEVLMVRPAERYFSELARLQQMEHILPQAARRVGSSFDDTRNVTVLPPTMTAVDQLQYNVEDMMTRTTQ